jgi:hypothetical protein
MKLTVRTGILGITSLGLMTAALGAGAPTVPDSFRACARKQDVLQRLSCYDAEMAKLDAPQAAAPAAAAAVTTAPAPPAARAATPPATTAASAPPPATGLGSEQLRNAPVRPLGEEQLRKPEAPASSSMLSSLKFWKSKDPQPAKEADAGMTARIDSLRKNASDLYVVTLDNGQVWRQLEAEVDFQLGVGDTVRIDRGAMGSYRLKPVREGWKRWIRVSRMQ